MTARSYQLTFEVLLESMSTLRETALLRASLLTLDAQQNGKRVEALAEIVLEHGRLVSCQLRAMSTGTFLAQGNEACQLLAQAGTLEWQVQPREALSSATAESLSISFPILDSQHVMLTTVGSDKIANVPKRVVAVDQARLSALPPKSRQALLLSDGKRSCSEIARLLGMSPEHTNHLMRWLSQQQLIIWSSSS